MNLFSITILLAFAARSVLSEVSWACTECVEVAPSSTANFKDMVMERSKAPNRSLGESKGAKGAGKGASKGSSKGMQKNGKKGMQKGGKKGMQMGMQKGGKKASKKGDAVVPVPVGKCAANQNNLLFAIMPDRENPLTADIDGPAAGIVLFFEGDFIGFQTQTILILAGGIIAQGQDSFVFFDLATEEIVGSIAVQFGNNLPVITGGTGIFLGADGTPQIGLDELGVPQLLFDICVSAI